MGKMLIVVGAILLVAAQVFWDISPHISPGLAFSEEHWILLRAVIDILRDAVSILGGVFLGVGIFIWIVSYLISRFRIAKRSPLSSNLKDD